MIKFKSFMLILALLICAILTVPSLAQQEPGMFFAGTVKVGDTSDKYDMSDCKETYMANKEKAEQIKKQYIQLGDGFSDQKCPKENLIALCAVKTFFDGKPDILAVVFVYDNVHNLDLKLKEENCMANGDENTQTSFKQIAEPTAESLFPNGQ